MARVPYCTQEGLSGAHSDLFERYEKQRSKPVSSLFRALAHVPEILEHRHAYSNSLRYDVQIDLRFRELAIMMVGMLTGAEYEFLHHWKAALQTGIRTEQLEALRSFKTSTQFDDAERAVLRYTREATVQITVSEDTWQALKMHFDTRQLVELVLIVAWYNQTVRVLVPLCIELEDDYLPLRDLLPAEWGAAGM